MIWSSWVVLATVLFVDMVWIRQRFCATICPYARLQGVLFDASTQVLAFDPNRRQECRTCSACVRVCPVEIDLREGQHDSCIACALCADRCNLVQNARNSTPLITYSFGERTATIGGHEGLFSEAGVASKPRDAGYDFRPGLLLRPAVLFPGIAALVTLALTFTLVASQTTFSMTVLPDLQHPHRVVEDGIEGRFLLALENRSSERLTLEFGLKSSSGDGAILPAEIELSPHEYRKVPVTLRLQAEAPGPHSIEVLAKRRGTSEEPVPGTANLAVLEWE